MQLRNPKLYRRLCEVFGGKNVRVHNPGVPAEFDRIQSNYDGQLGSRLERRGLDVGEQFSVCCPFCRDTRFRLHVNHMYATPEGDRKHGYLQLWHCFNEDCQADFENRKRFYRMLIDKEDVIQIDQSVNIAPQNKDVTLPGSILPLDFLLRKNRFHPAVEWCFSRGYDIYELSELRVGYCVEGNGENRHITGRLVAPFYGRGADGNAKLIGWTARRLHDEPDDDSPKWYHSKSQTGKVVYGLGKAARYQTIIIGEGPGDRWSVGPQACCLLGKTLTTRKADLIANAIKRSVKGDPWKKRTIVVLLDPDQDKDALSRGDRHHIENAVDVLSSFVECPVVGVYLPPGTDPGMLERHYLWAYIQRELKGLGLSASGRLFTCS